MFPLPVLGLGSRHFFSFATHKTPWVCWEPISEWKGRGTGVANASHGLTSSSEPIKTFLDQLVPGSEIYYFLFLLNS